MFIGFKRTIAAALFALGLVAAAPARAEYCETIDWGGARFPDGSCTRLHAATIRAGTTSELILLAERAPPPARVAELSRMIDEVAGGVGRALASLGAMPRLAATVHVVIVDDAHGTARAETVARTDGASDCALILYRSARDPVATLARTLAHEMFHCVQYVTWPRKTPPDAARWWTEGSAEWFEDLALPHRVAESDLFDNLRLFRERSPVHSLLDNQYANVVLFAWLGRERVARFISDLADVGEDQLVGARRALTDDEWQRFAQDYVDEQIVTPSGVPVSGAEFGPIVTELFTTTGRPGADPIYLSREEFRPLTLHRGKVRFASGDYAPTGGFGPRMAVFRRGEGGWTNLPSPLRSDCAARQVFTVAALSTAPRRLRVDPGTRASVDPVCRCPVGEWTIAADDLQSLSPSPDFRLVGAGDVSMVFAPGGTAEFRARNLRFLGPRRGVGMVSAQVMIERSYSASFTWEAGGDLLTMTDSAPLRIVERTTHYSSAPYGGGVRTQPPRRSESTSPTSGRQKMFRCEGDTLTITPPVEGVGGGRIWVDRDRELRYPYYGVFVRP